MNRLILFAKRPRLGHVKTRLVPPLRPEQALDLYRAFLADQLRFLHEFAGGPDLEVCFDDAWNPDPELAPLLRGVQTSRQVPGDLGARLLGAFRRSADAGSGATVIVGVDSPTLPATHVAEAFEALDSGAAGVVAPADDGGYVLIGMRQAHAPLFRDVPWGGDQVYRLTLERAEATGVELALIAPWYDVDDGASLSRLAGELTHPAMEQRAPKTARFVRGLELPPYAKPSS